MMLTTSTPSSPTSRRRARGPAVLGAVGVIVVGSFLAAAPANASATSSDPDPVGGLVGSLTTTINDTVHHATASKPTAPRPSAPKPAAPRRPASSAPGGNSAGGSVLTLGGGGSPLAQVSGGQSSAGSSGTSSQATLLALGGTTLIGSQADSQGSQQGVGPVPELPFCMASDGLLCLDLLYADSTATSSDSTTSTGIANLCLGGHDATGATCDGAHLGVAQHRTRVHRAANGRTRSTASSSAVNTCVTRDASCVAAGELLGSSSASGYSTGAGTQPTLAELMLMHTTLVKQDDTASVEAVKTCTPEILCTILAPASSGPGTDDRGAASLSGLEGNLTGQVSQSRTSSTTPDPATPPAGNGTGSGVQYGSASSAVTDLSIADQVIALVSGNRSAGTPDHTTADATLLALFGQEVIASHADSNGETTGHGPVPQNPLCTMSGGTFCLDLLYADSAAHTTGHGSHADTRTGVADLCLGGDAASGASCSGIEAGLVQGTSTLDENAVTGVTTAGSTSSLANLCLHGDTACTISADALHSDGTASSTGSHSQHSSAADAGLDGTQVGAPTEPIDVSVPADCPTSNVACVFLNEGAQAVEGATTAGATVVGVGALGGTDAPVAGAVSTTGVVAAGGEPVSVEPPVVEPPVVEPPTGNPPSGNPPGSFDTPRGTPSVSHDAGVLPNTGGVRADVLGLGLLLVAAGAALLAGNRRRRLV